MRRAYQVEDDKLAAILSEYQQEEGSNELVLLDRECSLLRSLIQQNQSNPAMVRALVETLTKAVKEMDRLAIRNSHFVAKEVVIKLAEQMVKVIQDNFRDVENYNARIDNAKEALFRCILEAKNPKKYIA